MALTQQVIMDGEDYQAVCDLLRALTGSSKMIKSEQVRDLIESISGGTCEIWAYLDQNTLYLNRAYDFRQDGTTLEVLYGKSDS